VAVIPLLALGTAHGATLDFGIENIQDAVPGLFDPSATAWNDNILNIGLDNFAVTASGNGNNFSWAFDTISFTIVAPLEHVITKIVYKEEGKRNHTGITTFTAAIGSLTVGGVPRVFGPDIMLLTSGETDWNINPIEFNYWGIRLTQVTTTYSLLLLWRKTTLCRWATSNLVLVQRPHVSNT
jgi:hypothetical protein